MSGRGHWTVHRDGGVPSSMSWRPCDPDRCPVCQEDARVKALQTLVYVPDPRWDAYGGST